MIVADAAENRGLRKKRTSSIGRGVCASHAAKRPMNTSPITKLATTSGATQPWFGTSMMANSSVTSPTIDRTAPMGSSGLSSGALVFGMSQRAKTKVTAHTGTLMKNTEPQPRCSTSSPPTTGPIAIPMPATPAHTPIARARSAGSRNVLVRIDSVVGKMNAPPTPMSARAAISMPGEFAVDASAEKTPNHASPNISILRRP